MKSGENCTRGFRKKDFYIFYDFIHVYSSGARADEKIDGGKSVLLL